MVYLSCQANLPEAGHEGDSPGTEMNIIQTFLFCVFTLINIYCLLALLIYDYYIIYFRHQLL